MKVISVAEAEGTVLCHDITEIIPNKSKGRVFKKGHVVQKEDILRLLSLGKEHLYVWELGNNLLHEDDAAIRIAKAVAGPGLTLTDPAEGKVEIKAAVGGLLKINTEALESINSIDQVVLATLHTNQAIEAGKVVAGCRVVPLVVDSSKIHEVEEISHRNVPVIEIKPFKTMKVGVVTTGSEVYHARIKDQFAPLLTKKLAALGSTISRQILAPDDIALISQAIQTLISEGADVVLTTGGMSVYPDDVTPTAIRAAGGRVVVYGAPVLPGSMFMLAYIGDIPILGLPGCVMYHKATIFDLILPRILAGEQVTRQEVVRLGHGGLCLGCESCGFPNCGFGKSK
jgi:molybdenum cofactor synthesis domain-containing protein